MENSLVLYNEIKDDIRKFSDLLNDWFEFGKTVLPQPFLSNFNEDSFKGMFTADMVGVFILSGYHGKNNKVISEIFLWFYISIYGNERLQNILNNYQSIDKMRISCASFMGANRNQTSKYILTPIIARKIDSIFSKNYHSNVYEAFLIIYNTLVNYQIEEDKHIIQNNKIIKGMIEDDNIDLDNITDLGDGYFSLDGVFKLKEGKHKIKSVSKGNKIEDTEDISLDTVMNELNSLVGMDNVKDSVRGLINYLNIQKERTKRGLSNSKVSLHCVFYGPPGTGKTTVARIIGKIYKCLGFLPQGQVVETDRAGLIAGYVGQTAIKVDEVVDKALGGILFIDEAYSLTRSESSNDFGIEAIDILIKRMEDNRDNLAIVVAGYKNEMEDFIESNPGMKSRFNRYFYFNDFEPNDLMKIFKIFCSNSNYKLSSDGEYKLLEYFTNIYQTREKTFGNGRFVRNIFEKLMEVQANRVVKVKNLTDDVLISITSDDVEEMILNNKSI